MKLFLSAVGVISALAFSTVASAYTCPANEWCFGPTNGTTQTNGTAGPVTQGATFTSATFGTINVFSYQVTGANGGSIVSTITKENGTATLGTGSTAMFQVSDSVNDEGVGIAPYNPSQGSGGTYDNQNGIDSAVPENSTTGTYGNILELELGANIASGTTLKFLLQAGNGDGNVASDQVTYYAHDETNGNQVNPSSMGAALGTTALNAISQNGTTSQFSITKDTNGIEFVAIEADCHYILLDTITGQAGTVPEPRFYGILLAGLLGLAGIAYKRRAAQVNA